MNYRRLGRSNLRVSEVGFGSWAIGGPVRVGTKPFGWGPVDDATTRGAVRRALDLGINFFDTADVYGIGRSEEILGLELKGKDVLVATKAGNVRTTDGENSKNFSKSYLVGAVEKSLKRLRREAVDVLHLHNPTEADLREGECLEVLEELREAGKIRATGVSVHKPEEALVLLTGPRSVDAIQLVYNLLATRMAERVLPLALEEDVGIIVRVPLQYGLLTGKFGRDAVFGETDHRSWNLSPELIERGTRLLEALAPQLEKHQLTPARLALKFALAHPAVSVTIPGAKTAEQVEANASASDGRALSPALLQAVSEAQGTRAYALGEGLRDPVL